MDIVNKSDNIVNQLILIWHFIDTIKEIFYKDKHFQDHLDDALNAITDARRHLEEK